PGRLVRRRGPAGNGPDCSAARAPLSAAAVDPARGASSGELARARSIHSRPQAGPQISSRGPVEKKPRLTRLLVKSCCMDAAPQTSRTCPACGGKRDVLKSQGDRAAAGPCDCSRECSRCGGRGHFYETRQETFSRKVGPRTYEVLVPCACRLLPRRLQLYCEAQIPAVLARAEFDNFRPSNAAQDQAKTVATAFARGYLRSSPPKGFVLSGPVGTGKTHLLAASLAYLALELGVQVQYVEISLLYAQIRRGFQEGKSGGEIIGPLSEVEVGAI